MDAAKGNNPYLIAALKSLPLTADEPVSPAAETAAEEAGASQSSRGIGPARQEEKELAGLLMRQVQEELGSSESSLQEDEKLLQQLQQELQGSAASAEAVGFRDVVPRDGRLAAAVKYRIERKKLLQASQVLLNIFLRE